MYLRKFYLPSERAEFAVISGENRTCFSTFYPFKIFPGKKMSSLELDRITLLYGGNGSGKSTLINVMANKVGAARFSAFNGSAFFEEFVALCGVEYARRPRASFVLTSDDVFDYVLNARSVNEQIDDKREELFQRYTDIYFEGQQNPEIGRLRGLDDYERWAETREILSPRRSQSSYIKKRVASDVSLYSNGETALRYFVDRIDADALYFLDEPENSLSIELQIRLAEYIEATAIATKSQFVIATHSPVLLAMKRAKIYNLDARPATDCVWTELPNVRRYFEFFMEHRAEFE